MDTKKVIREFFHHFEKMDVEGMLPLTAPHAIAISPTLGKKEIKSHYQELFSKSKRIKIVIKDIFINPDNPLRAAAFFSWGWESKHGVVLTFDIVIIFEMNAHGKIQEIQIIYDAQAAREAFRKEG